MGAGKVPASASTGSAKCARLPLPREIQIAIVEHALPHTCTVGMSRHFKLPVPVVMRML